MVTELRSYLRTNKLSMDPQKLSDFTKNKLLPDEAKKYLHHIVEKEMPAGLKKYLEIELFPHVRMKLAKEYHFELRVDGCTRRVSGILHTRKHCIMMGMNEKMSLDIARMFFYPR